MNPTLPWAIICSRAILVADPGWLEALNPRQRFFFACQFENSHGPAFSKTLT